MRAPCRIEAPSLPALVSALCMAISICLGHTPPHHGEISRQQTFHGRLGRATRIGSVAPPVAPPFFLCAGMSHPTRLSSTRRLTTAAGQHGHHGHDRSTLSVLPLFGPKHPTASLRPAGHRRRPPQVITGPLSLCCLGASKKGDGKLLPWASLRSQSQLTQRPT